MRFETRPLRLCLVDCSLAAAFQELGHDVLNLTPRPGVCDLPRLLGEKGFTPDIVIQQERLGPRVLLRGLETLDCPKVFWSIDTHLNAFWQEEYARLFDLALSTQKHWAEALRHRGLPRTDWLPWYGYRLPWTPWKDRSRRISFVGRVTEHRPSRQRFVAFLHGRFGLRPVQDVDFQEMLGIYRQTWLAPNEAIFGEINFRLFEAASCGCLVLNQAGIPGLGEILEPEREVVLFSHVLELGERVSRCLNAPAAAERMAKAAWARVQEAHLAVHRARTLLGMAQGAGASGRSQGHSGDRTAWVLTLYRLWQAGRAPVPDDALRGMLMALPESPRKRTAILGFWAGTRDRGALAKGLAGLWQSGLHSGAFTVNLAASMAALRLGDLAAARAFRLRQHERAPGRPPPRSALELYLAWAGDLQRLGVHARPGLPFDHERHLPESVLECLIMAHRLDPRNMDVCRRMDALLDKQPGFEPLRLSLLSHLTLHLREDWLAGLKLGLVNLQGFRLEEGLEEIMLAEDRAGKRGESRKFQDALAVIDPEGMIRKALGRPAGPPTAASSCHRPDSHA